MLSGDESGFYVTHHTPHKAGCGVGDAGSGTSKKPRVRKVPQTASSLGIMRSSHVQANPRPGFASARTALADYCTVQPGKAMVHRALAQAKEQVNGMRSYQPKLLLQFQKEAALEGHTMEILTATGADQLKVLKEHKLKATKAVPPQSTEAIDEAISAVTKMTTDDPEVTFLVGYFFCQRMVPW